MSGVVPPVYPIVEPFGTGAVSPADITLPIPIPTQTGILVGAASFADGFPAATRTDPELGGKAPYGQDVNGIFYMLSAYAALLQAGQRVPYSAAASAAFTGYAVGAQLASIAVPGRVWTNVVDGNTNNPDVAPAGWWASDTQYVSTAPAAGTYSDIVIPGASNYALDYDTTAGAIVLTGFVAQRVDQRLFISNTGANLLTLPTLTGSAASNQIRGIAGGLALAQGQTVTIQKIGTLDKWLFV